MPTTYVEILARQRPFHFGEDDQGRVMFSSNFDGMAKAPIDNTALEIAKVLIDASLGTLFSGTSGNIFTSPHAVIPAGAGPFMLINETGGLTPLPFHDGGEIERVSFQITVRGANSLTTKARALAIWRAVHGIRSQTLTPAA